MKKYFLIIILCLLPLTFFAQSANKKPLIYLHAGKENADSPVHGFIRAFNKQALVFSGEDYIDMGDILNDEIKNSFTITAWINLDKGALNKPHNYIFWKSDDSPGLRISGDKVIFAAYHSGKGCAMSSRRRIKEGSWYYLAFTFDGKNFTGYINGVKEAQMPDAIGYYPGGNVCIGRDEKGQLYNRFFKGRVAEVKIWAYPLSHKDIILEYASGSPVCVGGLLILAVLALASLFYFTRYKKSQATRLRSR